MKKIIPLLALAATLSGCAALQNKAPDYRKMMVGNWMLDDISVEGQEGSFKVTLFNEAPLECFSGSAWTLTRPNSLGTYVLNEGVDCQAGLQREIRWTIYKTGTGEQQFQFKRLDAEGDPMDNNVGYRLDILSLDASGMQLRDEVTVNGQPLYLVYTFSRQ
ncbi:lipocalin-like protein [Anseongella ginsenosidimutans]|uniref:Lipocalin-like protein n=2 Tax=Anseongella ginsenosidimutans TaxID=496056 RepID=A0A4R3KS55_9SPHI|nr:lipocalin-like protein [Anseongella ginsenosidimutans]